MDVGTLVTILGPTIALTVAAAGAAIIATHGNSVRITIIEKAMEADRNENSVAHQQIKQLIIESEKRILQALRNGVGK